jgi:hypothetical protein
MTDTTSTTKKPHRHPAPADCIQAEKRRAECLIFPNVTVCTALTTLAQASVSSRRLTPGERSA